MESLGNEYLDTWFRVFDPGQRQQEQRGNRKAKRFGVELCQTLAFESLLPWLQELLMYLWAQKVS